MMIRRRLRIVLCNYTIKLETDVKFVNRRFSYWTNTFTRFYIKFQYFHTRFNLHFESNYHPDTCFSLINPTNRHDEKRNRESENWEIYPRSLIQTIFHEKKKKNRTEEKLIQPFPALHSRHVRPKLFSRFSFRLRSIFISLRNSPRDRSNILRPLVIFFFPPPFRPLHYSSERHQSLPSKILLGRSCYLVPFRYPWTAFPTLSTNGETIFEAGIIVVEQRTFCALSCLPEVEGVWRNIEEFFSPPHSYSLSCYSWIFLPLRMFILIEYFKLYRSLLYRKGGGNINIIRDTTFPRNFAISVGQ